jgi:hypothetical protein
MFGKSLEGESQKTTTSPGQTLNENAGVQAGKRFLYALVEGFYRGQAW